jgi:hypothetical protein
MLGLIGRRRSRLGLAALLLALALAISTWAGAAVVQQGNLRVTLLAQVQPDKLPRRRPAPIAVFVSAHVAAVHGGVPDQLQGLAIKVNRHALLRFSGLPTCPLAAIQPATTSRALSACGAALIGSGRFWAHIVLPEQGAYPTQGRLLVFNGVRHGRPAIFAQIYASHPFSSSFVIPFTMRDIANLPCGGGGRRTKRGKDAGSDGRGAHEPARTRQRGRMSSGEVNAPVREHRTGDRLSRDPTRATEDTAPRSKAERPSEISGDYEREGAKPKQFRCVRRSPYGTEYVASLPEALGEWGYVDRIKLTLRRKYSYRGRRLSYFNAACPALPGASRTAFHLAYATFSFADQQIGAEVTKACGVKP